MNDVAVRDGFLGKWRARWPEWTIAEVFLPAAQRDVASAWFALLDEFMGAARQQEAAPRLAKLAWWQQELQGWSAGARRHPLGVSLQAQAAEWNTLAQSLSTLGFDGAWQANADSAQLAMTSFANAVCEVEVALFGQPQADARLVSMQLLAEQVAVNRDPALAAHWLVTWPHMQGSRPRRVLNGLTRARLSQRVVTGHWRPLSRWRTLQVAWQAARHNGNASQ